MKRFFVLRVNGQLSDTYAVEDEDPTSSDHAIFQTGYACIGPALDLAGPDPKDQLEWGVVKTFDAGLARLLTPVGGWRPITRTRTQLTLK